MWEVACHYPVVAFLQVIADGCWRQACCCVCKPSTAVAAWLAAICRCDPQGCDLQRPPGSPSQQDPVAPVTGRALGQLCPGSRVLASTAACCPQPSRVLLCLSSGLGWPTTACFQFSPPCSSPALSSTQHSTFLLCRWLALALCPAAASDCSSRWTWQCEAQGPAEPCCASGWGWQQATQASRLLQDPQAAALAGAGSQRYPLDSSLEEWPDLSVLGTITSQAAAGAAPGSGSAAACPSGGGAANDSVSEGPREPSAQRRLTFSDEQVPGQAPASVSCGPASAAFWGAKAQHVHSRRACALDTCRATS